MTGPIIYKTAEAALYTLWTNLWAYADVILPCELPASLLMISYSARCSLTWLLLPSQCFGWHRLHAMPPLDTRTDQLTMARCRVWVQWSSLQNMIHLRCSSAAARILSDVSL